jgi:hypothetical protein
MAAVHRRGLGGIGRCRPARWSPGCIQWAAPVSGTAVVPVRLLDVGG